jgi:hypothetical protein
LAGKRTITATFDFMDALRYAILLPYGICRTIPLGEFLSPIEDLINIQRNQ